ncbi:hypothetical protein NLI96_g5831 [Meripilus lineatus]|uniref:FCP1 homology domain-containing protein n=1 Tax=Meripilus lineatus TaxID=2056292 RepID=A0AAD5V442_9APHY|nr:hypothetical protein NLI96_g5831 [Physisporinus lineatus]
MASLQPSTSNAVQDPKGKELEGQPASARPAEGSSSPDSTVNLDSTPAQEGDSQPAHSDVPNGRPTSSEDHPVAEEQGQAPPPKQSIPSNPNGTTQTSQPNSSLASVPSGKERPDDSDVQKETEKASLNTTLTGTHTHPHTQSTRPKEAKALSDGAHTASTSTEQRQRPKSIKKKAKGSLFARLFHAFVPCVGPSTRAHDIETLTVEPEPTSPDASATALKEKVDVKQTEEVPPNPTVVEEPVPAPTPTVVETQPSDTPPPSAEPEPEPEASSLTPLEIPPAPSDPAVVVPPTPTKSLLPREETEGMTSGAVQAPGSTGDDSPHEQRHATFTEDEEMEEGTPIDEAEDEEERLILNGGAGIPIGPDGMPRPLLPPLSPKHAGRKCLVLDLDETLVHSSFKSIQQADYVVPVEIEYHWHNVYVIKRPGVDNFLKKMGEIYEVVVFTASLSKYADPVLDKLDVHRVVSHRLFRESCYNHRGNYVKDLSQLGRPISDTIIIDNSPASYIFHPNNAVPVSSWFTDPHDQELNDLCPFLTDLATVDDVRGVLDGGL